MKYLFILAATTLLSAGSYAQGKGKGKGQGHGQAKVKVKENKAKVKTDNNNDNNDGRNVKVKGRSNASTAGVPAKVQAAFTRDYGNVSNVTWRKNRGNWTATYNGGLFGGATSIATYHANGARMDTRTSVPLTQIPQPVTIWQQRNPSLQIGRIVRIDLPGQQEVYQVTPSGSANLVYLNRSGTVITFNPR